ncbi:MAG: NADH-quinone oxidoreductase subunit NuoE [Acidobacteria bacterium]|nr:NADH-quinone oxidoreductase subunit NuoE [Acidobacteriota bacterium]
MLSAEEKAELDRELQQYPARQSACIDAMKIVQRHRRWLSDEALRDIGEYLGMSVADLDGVATFYNLLFRKPVGRHVVMICDSVTCWIMGYEKLRDTLMNRLGVSLGETTSDDRFTVLPIVCLGNCDKAPTLMVDRDTYGNVSPETVEEILARYK